ncbi:Ldh family oxidoreductase [Phycicoccus sonneratiae]|uniref:Ldh family oxidoreductase n=1 Tax=Phycicoccus sonneratiae TaxID=2807628 RepID=A0ABS2CQI8_9MICO|nr:Ldh family oxidoreductase [Phycicoccus sonneraticus]MBM6402152.1 Ldh family oxidoreductase [Phycicoccus sonneraticus]
MTEAPATTAVRPEQLRELCAAVLESVGVPATDAEYVADSLVTADAWGHPSHGVLRLSWYVERLRSGVMNPVTRSEHILDGGAVNVLDGRDGIGQVVTRTACDLAVERAQTHGVGVVAVRNSNHFGTAAYFTRAMAEAGCAAILTTNGSPAMAPWGGRVKTVGANPWSIAVPGGTLGPVVLDIANTTVARGKVYAARERGTTIPDGWAIDADGVPTTDPQAAIDGLILPMAAHKGYAISFMMDILSGVLTGSSYATDIAGPYVPDRRSGCGHLVIAIRVDAVRSPMEFGHDLATLIDGTKSVPLAAGHDEVFYPGEIEDRNLRKAQSEGISLPRRTIDDLCALAASCGVDAETLGG